MEKIENRTFAEMKIGDSASLIRQLTQKDIDLFAIISGDVNPAHVDPEYAKSDMFHGVIAHGMWGGAIISAVLGTELPGPGTIYLGQTFRFRHPVALGDTVTVTVKVAAKDQQGSRVRLDCTVANQRGQLVMDGSADVIAPTEKVSRPRISMPSVELHEKGRHYRQLLARCQGLEPLRTAVVHPVDPVSLVGAVEAAAANLIVPVLIGPEKKIRAAAEQAQIDIGAFTIVSTEHSHAAALKAAEMAKEHSVEALMKGSLHTDELMHAVLCEPSLRTDRRVSHVFVIDASGYPRPLYLSDAAINIYPTLEDKRDIVQNAIDLARALGVETPKVAILSAVETVTEKIRSTIDAAALCKMADRGQITGGILDGPLAFDNAVSADAARTKGIISLVAGQADIFIMPDLEAGNMLAKQLCYLADADAAGVVMGARVPIILTSRADRTLARLSSCAVALLYAQSKGRVRR
jgi:phosphate acetyltransferase/phosphate butyryltransferase